MARLIFFSHATPHESHSAEWKALDRFFDDVENELRLQHAAAGRPDRIAFLAQRDIAAGTANYEMDLRQGLQECPLGIVLLQPAYLSADRPSCRWEFEAIRKRSEWSQLHVAGQPKLLFVIDWMCVDQRDFPQDFPQQVQRVRESIAGQDEKDRDAIRYVTSRGLLHILNLVDNEGEIEAKYLRFVQCLTKCIYRQYTLFANAAHLMAGLPDPAPFDNSIRWIPSQGKTTAGKGAEVRTEPARKKIISTVVAATPTAPMVVERKRAWRYLDDGRDDWRPYAIDTQEGNARIKDILDRFQKDGVIVGEVIPHPLNRGLIEELASLEGKYPFVIFVDPWTLTYVAEVKALLGDLLRRDNGDDVPVSVISLRNDFDPELVDGEPDSMVVKFFRAFNQRPVTASSVENLARVLRIEIERQRNRIRDMSTSSIPRSGAPLPTLSAAT